ncbi:hypothetical protein FACS1894193_07320 [Bacilli bacterium]|nr:hypothetical protein FACS1894193_07320 [Bacilli bacterium]
MVKKTTLTQADMHYIMAQIFLIDPISESPRLHPKRKAMKKAQVIKRLELLVENYKSIQCGINLSLYEATIKQLKKIKVDEYEVLINDLFISYERPRKQLPKQVENIKKEVRISKIAPRPKQNKAVDENDLPIQNISNQKKDLDKKAVLSAGWLDKVSQSIVRKMSPKQNQRS